MKDNIEVAKEYTDWLVKNGGHLESLTLRDHFAGLAMQAYLMDEAILQDSDTSAHWLKKTAESAYEQADAMLKERAK
jgi:hypothetical protein